MGFTRGSGPADRQDSGVGHPQAPDEGGEVGAGVSALLASRVPLPVELSPVWVELGQASARLEMPIWQVIEPISLMNI